MSVDPLDRTYQGNRMRALCGRRSPGPWLPRYTHPEGAPWKPRVWVAGRFLNALRGLEAVWVCRDARDHDFIHRRNVWRKTIHDYDLHPPRGKRQLRLRALGKLNPTRRVEWILWPSKHRTIGHHYVYDRTEVPL